MIANRRRSAVPVLAGIVLLGLALALTLTLSAILPVVTEASKRWPRCQYYSPYACKAKQERACGKVRNQSEGTWGHSRTFARGASCRVTRRLVREPGQLIPPGWRVVFGSGEGAVYAKGPPYVNSARLPYRHYVRSTNLPLRKPRSREVSSKSNVSPVETGVSLRARLPALATFRKIRRSVRRWSSGFFCAARRTTRISSRNRSWAVAQAINNCSAGSSVTTIYLRRRGAGWRVAERFNRTGWVYQGPPCSTRTVPRDIRCGIR